jgi:hypothetical protein
MRNLKIYKLERSEYLLEIANKIKPISKWKDIRKEYDIKLSEWNGLAGYWNSNDYNGKKRTRKRVKREATRTLKKLPYEDYLRSDHWTALKEEIRRVFKTCVICNSKSNLNVHHRSYKHRGNPNKEIRDLILLCAECHNLFHTHGKLKR